MNAGAAINRAQYSPSALRPLKTDVYKQLVVAVLLRFIDLDI
jgi:hypothetical protein